MSVRVSVDELHEQLPELLRRAAEGGEACIVQQDGKDYAVLIGVDAWERTNEDDRVSMPPTAGGSRAERRREIGRVLDAMGPEYRFPAAQQARVEELLEHKDGLSDTEREELDALLEEADAVMLRRAEALDRLR